VRKHPFAGELCARPACGWGEEGPAGSGMEIVQDVTDSMSGTQIFCMLAAAARWPDPMAIVELNFHMLDIPSRGDDRASLVQRSDGRRQTDQT